MGMSDYGVRKTGQTKYRWPLLSLFQICSLRQQFLIQGTSLPNARHRSTAALWNVRLVCSAQSSI